MPLSLPETVITQATCRAGDVNQKPFGTAGKVAKLVTRMRATAAKGRIRGRDRAFLKCAEAALRQYAYGGVDIDSSCQAAGVPKGK